MPWQKMEAKRIINEVKIIYYPQRAYNSRSNGFLLWTSIIPTSKCATCFVLWFSSLFLYLVNSYRQMLRFSSFTLFFSVFVRLKGNKQMNIKKRVIAICRITNSFNLFARGEGRCGHVRGRTFFTKKIISLSQKAILDAHDRLSFTKFKALLPFYSFAICPNNSSKGKIIV